MHFHKQTFVAPRNRQADSQLERNVLLDSMSQFKCQLEDMKEALAACSMKSAATQEFTIVDSALEDQRGSTQSAEVEKVVESEIDLDKGDSSPVVILEAPIAMLETPIGNSLSSVPFNSLVVCTECIVTVDTQLKVTTDEEAISSNNAATLFEKSPQKGIVATNESLDYCVDVVFDRRSQRHETEFARQFALKELFLVPFVPTISYQVPIMSPHDNFSVNFDGGCYSVFVDEIASGYHFAIGVPWCSKDVIICSMVEFVDISFSDHHILHHFPFDPRATHFIVPFGGTWMVHSVWELLVNKRGELLTMKHLRHYLHLLYEFTPTFARVICCWWQHKWNSAPTTKKLVVLKAREGISDPWLKEVDVRDPTKHDSVPTDGKIIGHMLRGASARTGDSRTLLEGPIIVMLQFHIDETTWVNVQAGSLLKVRFHFSHSNTPFELLLRLFASEASVMLNRNARPPGITYSFDPGQLNATSTPRDNCDLPNFHSVEHNLLANVFFACLPHFS